MQQRGIGPAAQRADSNPPIRPSEIYSAIPDFEGPYRFFMFSQRRMNHTAIEQNLWGVGNTVEGFESLVDLVIVVLSEGGDPGFDFL